MKTIKNRQKKKFSDFRLIFLIIFLQHGFYPDVEFYDEKKIRKNIYLTDIKAQKGLRGRTFISLSFIELYIHVKFIM